MLEKVFYTSVLVSDQDQALDFYTNVLGLETRVENPTRTARGSSPLASKAMTSSWFSGPGHPARPSRRWVALRPPSRSRPTIAVGQRPS